VYKLTINLQFYLEKHLLWYLKSNWSSLQRILLVTKEML